MPVDMQIIADTSARPAGTRQAGYAGASPPTPKRRSAFASAARKRHAPTTAARQRWQTEAHIDWDASPITTARLASEVWDAIKGDGLGAYR